MSPIWNKRIKVVPLLLLISPTTQSSTHIIRYEIISYKQKTPWLFVRKRSIPTERPPLVGQIKCQLLSIEGCRVVSAAEPPRPLISVFQIGTATSLLSSSSFILTRAEWTPFQTHFYSEKLVASVIELGTSGLKARNSDH
jgi:hypothetical protein